MNSGTRFLVDGRNREDLLDMVGKLAASYVPEWKFDMENPDPLSVIAMIFSNQTQDNIKRLNMLLHKYHVEFANMYGMSRKPAIPARTICAFDISAGIESGVEIKKGTQVIGTAQDGDEIIFTLAHDINAVGVSLTDAIAASGREKKVVAYNVEEGFHLFSYKGENIHRQTLVMYFGSMFDERDIREKSVSIRFGGNLESGRLSELFACESRFSMTCASEEGLTAVTLEMVNPVDENIVLDSVELFASEKSEKPEFICNGRGEVSGSEFAPFTEQPALYHEFFIGQEILFGYQGARITLHFDLRFERFAVREDDIGTQDLRIIKKRPKSGLQKPHYTCYVQEVTFEYFNAKGWRRLNTDIDMSAIFAKEENSGTYDISFEVPGDWESVVQGGYEGRCIRMQVVRADNCYMQEVEFVYPVLSGMNICMSAQSKGILPKKIVKIQGSDEEEITGLIAAGRGVPVFTQLEYAGDYVYLGFDGPLGAGPASMFVELERTLAFKECKLEFAYSAMHGFKPLKVIDNTDSFQNSGIILFTPPADMAIRAVEGIERYWLRIEDTKRYFAKNKGDVPFVKGIHMNAVMAENIVEKEEHNYYIDAVMPYMRFPLYSDNILSAEVWVNEKEQLSADEMKALMNDKSVKTRAEYNFLGDIEEFYILWSEVESFEGTGGRTKRCYCIDRGRSELIFGDGVHVKVPLCVNDIAFKAKAICCDGEKADILAGSIGNFRGAILAVDGIRNPIDAYGGTNLEELGDALERGSNILSSRGRMVSERDYIKETMAFSDSIEQAACVAGLMKNGQYDDAVISVVLLMKDYKKGSYSFRSIMDPLKEYLMERCEVTCGISDVQVAEPVFVKISTDIWLEAPDLSNSIELKHYWIDKITDFLEPIKRKGGAGWQIGCIPSERQIRLMLGGLEDTARIVRMNVTAQYTHNQHDYTMGLDAVEKSPFMACCNGVHNIYINNSGEK